MPDDLLVLAERVVLARQELERAEAAFRAAAGPSASQVVPKQKPPVQGGQESEADASVAQRVRELLQGGRALSFGDFVIHIGDREARGAIKSALKKLREKDLVRFSGGKYAWKGPAK